MTTHHQYRSYSRGKPPVAFVVLDYGVSGTETHAFDSASTAHYRVKEFNDGRKAFGFWRVKGAA